MSTTSTTAIDWTTANQQFVLAELAWLKQCLEGGSDPASALDAGLQAAAAAMPAQAAIDTLAELFDLSPFERQLLLLCAGVELDAHLAVLCGRVQGSESSRHATFGLALAALPNAHWSALTPTRPLRRWRLIEVDPGPRLVDSPLRIDERILHYLTGLNYIDGRIEPMVTARVSPALMASAHQEAADRLVLQWSQAGSVMPVLQLTGDDDEGQNDVAARVAAQLGLRLFVMSGAHLPAAPAEIDALATLCAREMRLLSAALLLTCGDTPNVESVCAFVDRVSVPLLITARESLPLSGTTLAVDIDKPEPIEQKRLWHEVLGARSERLNGSIDTIAAQFRLSAGSIASIAATLGGSTDAHDLTPAALWQACRVTGRKRLDDLAERITPASTWDDLVVPDASRDALHQIAAHVRQRVRVHDEWGFAERTRRGVGVTALFCGESGTGKTLAAEVLAHALGLDLYRIDLSTMVSKYIGETEKNLRRVFDAAEDSGSILLFDEADALFGKRSEVKDSHDRYANIEVSYLLQRMEAYRGLALLTTNMKSALDRAFQRRLRFIVSFPFPDHTLREAIWRRIFPAATPLGAIEYRKLAQLHLPGGNIRNIALNAAFLAADAGNVVEMSHLLAAAHAESAKLERPFSEAEVRGWA